MAKRQRQIAQAKQIAPEEMIALSEAYYAKELSAERLAHARTRADLIVATSELRRAQADMAAREAGEISKGKLREASADFDAAHKSLSELTLSIRQTHNLTDKHAIDGATGAIIDPESLS